MASVTMIFTIMASAMAIGIARMITIVPPPASAITPTNDQPTRNTLDFLDLFFSAPRHRHHTRRRVFVGV